MEFNEFENMLQGLKKVYIKKPKRKQTLLEVSGFPRRETVYSNLLAFFLDETEEHELGSMVLEALLKAANINNLDKISNLTIEKEYPTEKGKFIDLVLYNNDFVIGIENKISAPVYNDLQDYANTIEKINPNAYKIILSVKDETKIAKQNNYINVTYAKIFEVLEPTLKSKVNNFDNNKWLIYLQDLIENIKRLEVDDMENKEMIQWANSNKENIEMFYDFLSSIKKELNHKAKALGNILTEVIEKNKLYGKVWYWNINGKEKEICTMTVVELDKCEIAIDSQIGINGWGIYITLRKNIAERKRKILEKLRNNNIEVMGDDFNKIHICQFDYYTDYEEIVNKVITVLNLFQYTKSNNGIIGFTIGDALGVPAEFKSREELKSYPITDMIGNGTHNVPAGTWSDDTSMTLATVNSLINTEDININDIANKFLDWFRNSNYTATNETFDIGRTTLQALEKFELNLDNASICGGDGEYDNGNGSLMRMLPIAYYIFNSDIEGDKKIYNIVKSVSSITHAHEISILGCYIYVRFVLELLNGKDKYEAYKNIQNLDYSFFNNETIDKYIRILKDNIQNVDEKNISSAGYVVSTLEATLWLFLNSNDYNTTILKAVNLGEDTDTVAACTGGLLGIYYGIDNIKENWKQTLKRYDYIIDLCNKFDNIKNK